MANAGTISVTLDANSLKLLRELKKAQRETRKTAQGIRKDMKGAFDAVSRSARLAQNAIAAVFAARAIKGIVDAGMQMQRFERSMRVATGSAEQAAKEMAFVQKAAKDLGLNLETTAGSYSKLIAAAKGTSLAGKESREIFLAISEASTVLGLTTDQTAGALTAIEQIISKGKVSAEELRGQLGERLPGAFQIAARAIGVTTSELDDMLKKGELTAEDLLPKLAKELRATFGPQAAEGANSAEAAINRLSTAIFNLKASIAESGVLDAVSLFANALAHLISGDGSGFGAEADRIEEQLQPILMKREQLIRQIEGLSKPGARNSGLLGDLVRKIKGDVSIDELKADLAEVEVEIRRLKALQLDILTGGGPVEKASTEAVLARFDSINAMLDKTIGDQIKREQEHVEKVADSFKREFETAEQEVARRLDEFSIVEHLFPPDERERIKKAIRETLYDGIEEIEIKVEKRLPKKAKEGFDEMSEYAKQAARNIQDAFADFLFDPFEDGLKGMLKGFLTIIRRMLAEIVSNQILSSIFGSGKAKGGGLGGFLGGIFGGGVPGQTPPILPRAAGGPVSAYQPFLVGEMGPELFIPGSSGTIIPNHKLSESGSVVINNNLSVAAGVTYAELQSFLPSLLDDNRKATISEIRDLRARNQF